MWQTSTTAVQYPEAGSKQYMSDPSSMPIDAAGVVALSMQLSFTGSLKLLILATKRVLLLTTGLEQVPGSGYGQKVAAAAVTAKHALHNAVRKIAPGQELTAVCDGPSPQASSGIQAPPAAAKHLPLQQGVKFLCLVLIPQKDSNCPPVRPCPACCTSR